MNFLAVKAPAKVNLYLRVIGKRSDGYHNIETIFQSISLFDELYLKESASSEIKIECEYPQVPPGEENTIYRAVSLLREYTGISRGIKILLNKKIPVGGGLGGAASDAAAVLEALNEGWQFNLSREVLFHLARKIGADVSFFLMRGTALGKGRGDELQVLPSIPPVWLVIVNPGFSVSTAEVYQEVTAGLTNHSNGIKILDAVKSGDIKLISEYLHNDLEKVVFPLFPILGQIKKRLIQLGARGALMAGSGSCIFGLVSTEEVAWEIKNQLQEGGMAKSIWVAKTIY